MSVDNFPTFRRVTRGVFRDTRIMLVVAIIVFALGVLASYIVASASGEREAVQYSSLTENAHDDFTGHIQTRVASYQALLRGSAGLLALKDREELTAAKWRQYVGILRSEQSLDDLQGIGYAEIIPERNLDTYRARMEREHRFDVDLRPTTPRSTYTSISYLEPMDADNRRAIGYDMFSDAVRRSAMTHARDAGVTALTAPVVSVQDITEENPPKTILAYFPVYSSSTVPATTAERQSSVVGYAYLLFRASDLLAEYRPSSSDGQTYLDIADVTDAEEIGVYRSQDYDTNNPSILSKTIDVGERKWRISLYLDGTERSALLGPTWLFIMGLLTSLLVAASLYLMLRHRQKIIEEAHEQELNRARNDLLALASHQLRTPATGTRQYIGMLIEGFFGPLNDEQISVAERAYNANERQLEIVDEILYVAKAESGQIFLNHSETDIIKLMRDIIANVHDDAKKKNIDINLVAKRKKLPIDIDSKYITMSLENLLSNAMKYSYPDSTIKVKIAATAGDTVTIAFIDQGVGIDQDSQARLFEKFARIHNPLSASEGGSGLGLYLAEKLINAHGGTIDVVSEVGKGSTFTVTLPVHKTTTENVVQLTEYR